MYIYNTVIFIYNTYIIFHIFLTFWYNLQCIHATAERLAAEFDSDNITKNFTYCSAKYSQFYDEHGEKISKGENIPKFAQNNSDYREVGLERDSHFYDINVNTSTSCIHVPTNIFYKGSMILCLYYTYRTKSM